MELWHEYKWIVFIMESPPSHICKKKRENRKLWFKAIVWQGYPVTAVKDQNCAEKEAFWRAVCRTDMP